MNKENQRAIIVLGMHRSGTSAISGGIANMGVEFGDHLMPAAPDNPRGFWENEGVVEINDKLLDIAGMNWSSVREFPVEIFESTAVDSLKSGARSLLVKHFANVSLWGIKDPRLCRLLPFWQSVFEDLKVNVNYLFIVRHPQNVYRSLKARNGFNEERAHWLWVRYILDVFKYIESVPVHAVSYDQLIKDSNKTLSEVSASLNLSAFDQGGDTSTIDPSLQNHEGEIVFIRPGFSISQVASGLYDAMKKSEFKGLSTSPVFINALALAQKEVARLQEVALYTDLLADLTDSVVNKEKDSYEEVIAQKNRAISELNQEIGLLRGEALRSQETLQQKNETLQQKNEKLQQKNERLASTSLVINDLQLELDELRQSFSWRITAPYRFVSVGVKKLFRF